MQIKICRLEIQIHHPHRLTIISFQSLILRHKILVFIGFLTSHRLRSVCDASSKKLCACLSG